MSGVKVGGVWKTPASAAVKVGGVWRTVASSSVKVGGAWRTSTLGSAPAPVIAYISTGVFEVTNTADTGVYTPTLISGGGTANVSTVDGKRRYSLTSVDARFSLTYSYAAGAPQSAPAFMERREYNYSCRENPYECCVGCQPCSVTCSGGCSGSPCPPGVGQGYGECGCPTYYCGTITVNCSTCCSTCYGDPICDELIDEPGYINSTTEWYKVT